MCQEKSNEPRRCPHRVLIVEVEHGTARVICNACRIEGPTKYSTTLALLAWILHVNDINEMRHICRVCGLVRGNGFQQCNDARHSTNPAP